jgi:hypothetical protein
VIAVALLLLAAASVSPADAERAFAARAQTEGQWTAFRAFATDDAVMFVPEQVNAQQWLKDRADPPVSVMWWPADVYASCDGTAAVNTGPWLRQGGRSAGYFTTVWVRQPDGGWKWIFDHGDDLAVARRAGADAAVHRPVCRGLPGGAARTASSGTSADGSLSWSWEVRPDKSRTLKVSQWDGRAYREVLVNEVAAPQ